MGTLLHDRRQLARIKFAICVICLLSATGVSQSQRPPPTRPRPTPTETATNSVESEKLKLAREQFENDKRLADERLNLDQRRLEIDERFFNRNLGTLITALLSLAAIIVSLSQIVVAYLSKKKEVEVAAIAKSSEQKSLDLNNKRDWNLKAVEFVTTHQELIFGTDRTRRERITSVMLATFPPEITRALFEKLEVAASTIEEREVWTAGQSAATKQLLVRVDGMYANVDKKNDYTQFLRFFPDGTVVSSTVSGTNLDAFEIARWLLPGSKHPQGSIEMAQTQDPGKFLIAGSEINFSATSSYGTVDYRGTVRGDRLLLDFHSRINDTRGSEVYYFVSATETTGKDH